MIFADPGLAVAVGKQHDWNELEILAQVCCAENISGCPMPPKGLECQVSYIGR
jgi:hypothetical protein